MPSAKPTILIQLDTDDQPSVFDGVVAVDSGVEHLFRHARVTPEKVRDLVHGAVFTRSPADLQRTAIFIGGSDVSAAEALLKAVNETFFGPFRVSVLLDANGANTTAAAAVLAALQGMEGSLQGVRAAVLAATGPVGQRAARLLGRLGAEVSVGSRSMDRACAVACSLGEILGKPVCAFETSREADLREGLHDAQVVIAAGTSGAVLLPAAIRKQLPALRVAIDLNAVPPLGIEGVEATDKKADREGVKAWGALGVGGTKMKIHKAALQALFQRNDAVLDAEAVLEIGRALG